MLPEDPAARRVASVLLSSPSRIRPRLAPGRFLRPRHRGAHNVCWVRGSYHARVGDLAHLMRCRTTRRNNNRRRDDRSTDRHFSARSTGQAGPRVRTRPAQRPTRRYPLAVGSQGPEFGRAVLCRPRSRDPSVSASSARLATKRRWDTSRRDGDYPPNCQRELDTPRSARGRGPVEPGRIHEDLGRLG